MLYVRYVMIVFLIFFIPSISIGSYDQSMHQVQIPSREKLEQDFKNANLSAFAQSSTIIFLIAGRTMMEADLLNVGIAAQLHYEKSCKPNKEQSMFGKQNQNKLFEILFQNNPSLLARLRKDRIL